MWTLIWKDGEKIRTERFDTWERAHYNQEVIIRKYSPPWSAITRDKRSGIQSRFDPVDTV